MGFVTCLTQVHFPMNAEKRHSFLKYLQLANWHCQRGSKIWHTCMTHWYLPFFHTRQWIIEQAYKIQLWMLHVYHISHDSCITYTKWLLVFSIVFKAAHLIWPHKCHCDVMIFFPQYAQRYWSTLHFQKFICPLFNESVFYGVWMKTKIYHHLINTISMRQKYSLSLGFYVILIPLGWNGRIFNGSL